MHNAVERVLAILKQENDIHVQPGGLVRRSEIVTDAPAVLAALKALGGVGWLQGTSAPGIVEWERATDFPADPGMILRAEAFDGRTTIQVVQQGMAWVIARIEEVPDPDGLLETVDLMRFVRRENERDPMPDRKARYHVAVRRVTVEGHHELQPVDYRFVGWIGR
ncbi:hypothetical protein JXA80_12920 [bacterium]|nr:hypothetical protein [candidate division CSSED10-310 bacterium]